MYKVLVDPIFKLGVDHSPRFGRWTVVQLEQIWMY